MRVPIVLCLVAASAFPLASADFVVMGDGPADDPIPYVPQEFCAFYFDKLGTEQRCRADGDVVMAGVLTVRSNGLVNVHAIIFSNNFALTGVICPIPMTHCDVAIPGGPHTGQLSLFARAWGGVPSAVATAEVATGVPLPP